MNFDEFIADCEAQRDAMRLQLHIIMASDIPNAIKNERIEAITAEVITLKNMILEALGEQLR